VTRSPLWRRESGSGEGPLLRTLRLSILAGGLLFLCFTAVLYLPWQQQLVLAILTLLVALFLNRGSRSYLVTITLMLLSVYSTLRYGFWRISSVIVWFRYPAGHGTALDAFFICLLLLAECYAFVVLMLGYLQMLWPLRRAPLPLPDNPDEWPDVDLLIPTLNEPLSVVGFTALAAMNIDWPAGKLNVYILDDGRRDDFRAFAEEAGIGYMTRDDNEHAKAGNLNSALARLDSSFVAVFDCDHVPTRSFLQLTMGWFLRDPKLAVLQTPHHFYSPDPFERNLHQFRAIPSEGELFYGVVQDGNDFWNSTLFCGSCAVLRRSALDAVGGVAVETVTEDAHTSLRMQKDGWNTAYINIPQAAGLATERLSAHVRQRIRWARGMVQILRIENPLFTPGLTAAQRLCYFNAMSHFLYALPRLIFLTAPLIYLVFGYINIPGYWAAILAYAAPHLILSNLTNSRVQGQHRHSFWNEIYETVLAPYILLPTLFALISPKFGRFNVTAKGGVVDEEYFDVRIARPFLALLALNLFGLLCAFPRFFQFPAFDVPWPLTFLNWPATLYDAGHAGTIWVNLIWTLFNVVILAVATGVAWETQQRRQTVRVAMAVPSDVILADGSMIQGITSDLSSGGVRTTLNVAAKAEVGDPVRFVFPVLDGTATLPATIIGVDRMSLRARFDALNLQEQEALTLILYSRADTWLGWGEAREADHPFGSFARIVKLALRGLVHAVRRPAEPPRTSPETRLATSIAPILLLCAMTGLAPGHARAATRNAKAARSQPASFDQSFTLADAGVSEPIVLRGADASHSVFFSLARNQVAKTAVLRLRYSFSPSLLPAASQLNVSLNGTLVATVPSPASSAENPATLETALALPAELLVHNNQLTFEFLGQDPAQCEDPTHSKQWSHIDASSSIEVSGALLPLANDLSILPLPFFDSSVNPHPTVPVVFLAPPSAKAIQAAGIVASWFGAQAADRPIRFPVVVGAISSGNAIVIAERAEQIPASLRLAAISGPTVAMRANPNDPASKLLVLTGSNADELVQAARALSLHADTTRGAQVSIRNLMLPGPRGPDDASRWLSTEKSIAIGDIDHAGVTSTDLQTDGSSPISVYFRLPPDLNYGEIQDLAFHLNYRYNGVPLGEGSALQVYANGAYVSSVPLPHTGNDATALDTVVPIPVADLRPFSNTLTFKFVFQPSRAGSCTDTAPPSFDGAVLKDSFLDIARIQHWAVLPNLELFANAGYPFTRYSDLAQTAVVLPAQPSPEELELFLSLMGHFGAQTGDPALNATVTGASGISADGRKDYLVLGTANDQPALRTLDASLPASLDAGGLHLRDTGGLLQSIERSWPGVSGSAAEAPGELDPSGRLSDALIEAAEWPHGSNRSVVAIVLRDPTAAPGFLTAFLAGSQSSAIAHSVSVLDGEQFSSYRGADRLYRVGEMSPVLRLTIFLQESPWLIALVSVVLCFLLASLLLPVLRRRAELRLHGDS
jgi:cellulose synthase (UDP-forming)